jgi:hypothetical protein
MKDGAASNGVSGRRSNDGLTFSTSTSRYRSRETEPVMLGQARRDVPELGDVLQPEMNRLPGVKEAGDAVDSKRMARM